MRYKLYGHGLKRETVLDKGVLAFRVTTNEIFRNMEGQFVNFMIIKFKFGICWKYLDKYFRVCQNKSMVIHYASVLAF